MCNIFLEILLEASSYAIHSNVQLYIWLRNYVHIIRICDRICEKGSYTCIHFFDFKDV